MRQVNLLLGVGVDTKNLISVADGVEFVGVDHATHQPGAAIPRGPFQVIDKLELMTTSEIGFSHGNDMGQTIAIINLGKQLQHSFFGQIHRSVSIEEVARAQERQDFHSICTSLMEALTDQVASSGQYDIRNLCVKAPGLITTTVDDSGRCIGLHLDSFDQKSLYERAFCRNRICINLGCEPRDFLCVRTSVAQMLEMMHDAGVLRVDGRIGSRLAQQFLRLFPRTEITRIRLLPFHAYIAPTENVVHDATTLGRSELDISLTVLGRFWLKGSSCAGLMH